MLDRSRSFPPSAEYAALPGAFEKSKKHKFVWYWEGGIGGLACGFTTGRKYYATAGSLSLNTDC